MATSTTSPDSGFTPRKEFIRQQKHSSNSFALLAVAQTGFIRFYSFPRSVVASLRRLFEDRGILSGFREDENQNLCEFTLEGKPWANAKSVTTEKLLVDIIAIIYHCGYTFLSTLDYGRESDDRLAMAFSKPELSVPGSRSGTPLPSYTSPFPDNSGSQSSDRPRSSRIPFAISFASTTLMRVIAPPLHLTPAILQAVRGSWPRGVVSEKKVGDNSFEFKLKGYKWFQQDTFATDSLRHILSLLSSLDSQSFTLLSSISLNPNRSRVKDLWIFTGPTSSSTDDLSYRGSPASSILNSSHGEIKRKPGSPPDHSYMGSPQSSSSQHRRLATEPNVSTSAPPPSQHARAVSDDRNLYHGSVQHKDSHKPPVWSPSSGGVLRKPAPRAQVPVSIANEADLGNEAFRANLPSVISNTNENMTGVGATGFSQHVYYTSSSPFGGDPSGHPVTPISPTPIHAANMRPRSATPPSRGRSPLRPVSSRSKTPPLLVSHSPSPPASPARHTPVPHGQQRDSMGQADQKDVHGASTPPLLGPGVFRDSAFSSNSDVSYDIPIKWTGIGDILDPSQTEQTTRPKPLVEKRLSSMGPMLPGAWQPSPIEEKYEEEDGMVNGQPNSATGEGPTTPIHEVVSRVVSPEMNEPDMRLRKSEAALVGMVAETMPSKSKDPLNSGTGQGWVLVNVEGANSPTFNDPDSPSRLISRSPVASPASQSSGGANTPQLPSSEHATMSPEAKAIVIIDAVDANNKSKAKTSQDGLTSPIRKRFFSLGRKRSKKAPQISDEHISILGDEDPKHRPGFRDKLRLIGTPEAPRNQAKRRSID